MDDLSDELELKPGLRAGDSLAVVGGGLSGLMSAWHAHAANPKLRITLYEKGSEESYRSRNDQSHRASLSGSPARMMRLSGAEEGFGVWNVRETKSVIDALQASINQHPEDYPGLEGRKLLRPEATVNIKTSDEDHDKLRRVLDKADVDHHEVSGAELKQRFPGLYATVDDKASAIVEEPFGLENPTGVCGVMDVEAIMQAMRIYLKKRGVAFVCGAEVTTMNDNDKGVELTLANGSKAQAHHAILAPGQWLEGVRDASGNSLTKQAGIQTRLERVLVADIDMKGLGVELKGIPCSRGIAPKGGEGSFYSHEPDSAAGHVKFIPIPCIRPVKASAELHLPVSEAEKEAVLKAASLRFGLSREQLAPFVKFHACAYTSPKLHEKVLVTPLREHITFIGLDSSSMARNSGGFGRIAAAMALGLVEPQPGAFETFNLDAHLRHINDPLAGHGQKPKHKKDQLAADVSFGIQQTLACWATDFIDPAVGKKFQDEFKDEHHQSTGWQNVAGEIVGDTAAFGVYLGIRQFFPKSVDWIKSGIRKLGDGFLEWTGKKSLRGWANAHHLSTESEEYKHKMAEWKEYQADTMAQTSVISVSSVALNVATQKVMGNTHTIPVITSGKLVGAAITVAATTAARFIFPKTMRQLDDELSVRYSTPLVRATQRLLGVKPEGEKPAAIAAEQKVVGKYTDKLAQRETKAETTPGLPG